MLLSPGANLYESILARLKTKVPELRYIEQDFGQLENYEMRPAVSWPCCLYDDEETKFSDSTTDLLQLADGMISLRLGLVKYSDSNNLTPKAWRERGLQHRELEQKIYKALHGWAPQGFSRLLRRAAGTERRDDDIRVRILKFVYSYTDTTAAPVKTKVPRPGLVINPTP